jgi:hypothetical protein
VIQDAKSSNKYSEGIVDVAGESIELREETTIHTDAASGAEVKHRVVVTDRGVPFQTAKER